MADNTGSENRSHPNIVYILADDLGYGDLGCCNPESKIPTPNLDRLSQQGLRFTDAHAPSSVCTPARYSILTGRYCWRTALKSSVLWPWDGALVEPDRLTVGQLLRNAGYRTACIGKWHLGWDWATTDGTKVNDTIALGVHEFEARRGYNDKIDFTKPVAGGPVDRGFDYYYGQDVPNFPPYTWFENDRILVQPTEDSPDEMFGCKGPMAPGWSLMASCPRSPAAQSTTSLPPTTTSLSSCTSH